MGGPKPGVGGAEEGFLWKQLETENWDWIRLEEVEPMPHVGGAQALRARAFKGKGPKLVPVGLKEAWLRRAWKGRCCQSSRKGAELKWAGLRTGIGGP